jgi:hypothetical protein
MLGSKTAAYKQVKEHGQSLIQGRVLSIDPSVGSGNSMPGWALYGASELKSSGTWILNPRWPLEVRLRELANHVADMVVSHHVDVLVYEDIPCQLYGFGNAKANSSLHRAVGAILSANVNKHVGISPSSWKKMVGPDYIKSDENDAIEIGRIVIGEARRICGQNQ